MFKYMKHSVEIVLLPYKQLSM